LPLGLQGFTLRSRRVGRPRPLPLPLSLVRGAGLSRADSRPVALVEPARGLRARPAAPVVGPLCACPPLCLSRPAGGTRRPALGASTWMRETGTVLVTLVVVAFGIVALLPGSVDVVLALLLVLAVPPLLQAGPARSATLELGLLAAVAAAAKVEGMILGLL